MQIVRAHDYPLRGIPGGLDYGMFTDGFQQAVDLTPTVDAKPVRHSKYNDERFDVSLTCAKCLSCGEYSPIGEYCFTCGAKMDKEDGND